MKRILLLSLKLFFFVSLVQGFPQSPEDLPCRTVFANASQGLSQTEQIRQDLLSGVWTSESDAGNMLEAFQMRIQFEPDGKGMVLQSREDGTYVRHDFEWNVLALDYDAVLIMRYQSSGQENHLTVQQTCYGIELTDRFNGKELRLLHSPVRSEGQFHKIRRELAGKWSINLGNVSLAVSPNPEIKDLTLQRAFLQYELQADGYFTKLFSSAENGIFAEERGKWELSKDGAFLLLHSDYPILTQCLRIKHLDVVELVLEQPLASIGQPFRAGRTDLFFNKQ